MPQAPQFLPLLRFVWQVAVFIVEEFRSRRDDLTTLTLELSSPESPILRLYLPRSIPLTRSTFYVYYFRPFVMSFLIRFFLPVFIIAMFFTGSVIKLMSALADESSEVYNPLGAVISEEAKEECKKRPIPGNSDISGCCWFHTNCKGILLWSYAALDCPVAIQTSASTAGELQVGRDPKYMSSVFKFHRLILESDMVDR
ncbi:hypothetical protein BJ508DRAFT_381588 [Ascobolus immersus RN42]|uniref:Uncharacterized protein n=1 Tax=Ascobolus immersus RN42 TaxID=1160509 RepID=A0A3N4HH30_ASCIM|nr:hypothetical protein BJ508DRAFT_381588 [Ascobolus immersus RN42]